MSGFFEDFSFGDFMEGASGAADLYYGVQGSSLDLKVRKQQELDQRRNAARQPLPATQGQVMPQRQSTASNIWEANKKEIGALIFLSVALLAIRSRNNKAAG